jgi:putative aldouronate transport system substrate-binding protein
MKKIISIMLSIMLVFSLVACGNKKDENISEGNGPVKLRIVMKDASPSNEESVKYFEMIEKELAKEDVDVKFELVEMPSGNYAEKLNLMLLGGDIPDIIYFQGGDQQIANQGLLEDLTPYVDKSKNIKNILQPHNKERLKNYPYLLWIKPIGSKVPVVRKDWFDKASTSDALLDNPTIDNYYEFFKELKENTFDNEEKPSYAITVSGKIVELDYIFNMAFGNTSTWMKNSKDEYIYSKVSQNEKEKLAFYHKLYKEGLLDKEYLTKKWDTKEKAFYEGDAGVIVGTSGKVVDIYDGKMKGVNGENATLVVLPPAKGKGQGYVATDVTKETRGIAISSQSNHKEVAFKVLDFLAGPKGQMIDRLGFEGEHYKINDGKIELTEKAQQWYAKFWEPTEFKPEKPLLTGLLGEAASDSLKKAEEYYTKDMNFLIPDEFVAKWDAMQNLYKEYSSNIITGKRSIDDFDEFVDKWYKAGGEEVTKYANENLK